MQVAGAFDLHWLERCPVLDDARNSAQVAHGQIRARAYSILDAPHGDAV